MQHVKIALDGAKYFISISVHSYGMHVMLTGKILATNELFTNCQCPGVDVDMIASNGCSNGEFKSCHYIRPFSLQMHSKPLPSALMFRRYNQNVRHLRPFLGVAQARKSEVDGVTASVSLCMYSECEPQLECCRTLHLGGKATEGKRAVTKLKHSPSSSLVTAPFSLVTLSLSCGVL